jgi:hypothetical protein
LREKRRRRKQKLEKPSKKLRRLRKRQGKALARVRVGGSARHVRQQQKMRPSQAQIGEVSEPIGP